MLARHLQISCHGRAERRRAPAAQSEGWRPPPASNRVAYVRPHRSSQYPSEKPTARRPRSLAWRSSVHVYSPGKRAVRPRSSRGAGLWPPRAPCVRDRCHWLRLRAAWRANPPHSGCGGPPRLSGGSPAARPAHDQRAQLRRHRLQDCRRLRNASRLALSQRLVNPWAMPGRPEPRAGLPEAPLALQHLGSWTSSRKVAIAAATCWALVPGQRTACAAASFPEAMIPSRPAVNCVPRCCCMAGCCWRRDASPLPP
mmetsp:Transcript_42804/g.118250  ORF Transcript_42804/g.118250 Transcript_42804/m.118250 type:complete len:255 (-) Transcript_42804:94-858(-)